MWQPQLEAQKTELLGPRRRREVTYNEARLARAADGAGTTPAKEAPDEDFAPTGTAAHTSDDDSGASDMEEERVEGQAGKRVCNEPQLCQVCKRIEMEAPPTTCVRICASGDTTGLNFHIEEFLVWSAD